MFEEIALGIALFSLIVLIWALTRISDLRKAMGDVKSKIDMMTAPAQTLTQVTTALQENIGTLGKSVTDITKSIGDISEQATKIETLGKKYEETEKLTRSMYSIMIGSYEKGKSGENYLRNMMNELMKIGLVRENVSIGNKVVEYCVVFNDGKLLPIDSKVVSTRDAEALFDEETSEKDRETLGKKIKDALGKKLIEVCQYIDPQTTLPCAVMAIPDSLVDLSSDIVPEAVKRNILVAGYSAVPQLIVYFIRIHGFYSIKEDVAELNDRLTAIHQEVSKLDDNYFAHRFERPVKMLTNATLDLRQIVSRIDGILNLQQKASAEMPEPEQTQE